MADKIAADMAKTELTIRSTGDVTITAGSKEEAKLPTFEFHGYTGAPMNVDGFFHPVIVDLAGATIAEPITALINHDEKRILGQGTGTVSADGIRATGTVMAEDDDAAKVLALSKNGFKWQASIGANVVRREFLEAGKTLNVNDRQVTGPLIIARESLVHEISFVRRGADSQTSAAVAASHSTGKVTAMDPKFAAWLETKNVKASQLEDEAILTLLRSTYDSEMSATKRTPSRVEDVLATAEAEADRRAKVADLTAQFINDTPQRDHEFISKIRALAELAIEAKWSAEKYDTELLRASRPQGMVFRMGNTQSRLNNRVIEAALCAAGRLNGYEKLFDDQTLQAAHDEFKGRIGLNQFLSVCAAANGYQDRSHSKVMTLDAHRAAFGMNSQGGIRAAFSTLAISTILSNTANKFLMQGWNAIDLTPLRISKVRPVSDLKTITTVSLTGDLQFEKLGPGGEIKHGTLGNLSYTNKADTYAKMLAITEDDIINDDLGALTDTPMRLGRGAALKLNDLFWTEFLGSESAGFFAAGNSNVNTGVADMTVGGLAATETIFMNQTDPDSKPLGIMPKIIVVPTALKAAAVTLMTSERLITGATSVTQGDGNIWRDRFRVESSPYLSNSAYTGYSSTAWYMLADPADLPMIEIVAYQGRVEPTVESANADFNTLGVQMRGYSRVGVARQEYRAAVKPDGGSS